MSSAPPSGLSLEDGPRSWTLPKGAPSKFSALELHLGEGANPLEVAVAWCPRRPALSEVRALWEKRKNKRASPVLCVVLYHESSVWQACLCGPSGDDPRVVFDFDVGQTTRLCSAALEEPNRHAAVRFLLESIPDDQGSLLGLRNVGMFATHHLRSGVPQRSDWEAACGEGRDLLGLSDRQLVEGLGYAIERRDTTTSLLRADGAAYAIAVFLHEDESADGGGQRYGGTSPASHALAAADRERLPYAVVTRGRQIRIYATGNEVGVGRKGRTETFIEVNLAVLPDGAAGYLPLIFGAGALAPGGSFDQILERSRDFAAGLGERLRDRVYQRVVPRLARAVASRHPADQEPDLEALYEQTLVILFRLLFVAYAEDKDLLPYRSSGEYSRHALKTTARALAERLNEGGLDFDPEATDLWAGVIQLFRAVELGNDDWQVPRYNGSLFSSEAAISLAGAAISAIELTNAEIGPALAALLVDEADDHLFGPVDFRSLSVREFGTIYEGLLESDLALASQDLTVDRDQAFVPADEGDEVEVEAGDIYLHNRSGARKATGSYFTKPFAVEHLLDQALEPALNDHLDRLKRMLDADDAAGAGEAFFDFRCADLAMGSGHFLVAAVDRIEARLSSFLVEHPVPAVTAELERLAEAAKKELGDLASGVEIDDSSLLRRQVARRCIYGIDRNLIAVELARLALWIHTFIPGLPLGFLDRTLVHGDSLTGIGTLDEAVAVLDPSVDGDRPSLYRDRIEALVGRTESALSRLGRVSDASSAEVKAAREAMAEAEAAAVPARQLFDLLVAIRLGRAPRVEEIDEETIATAAESADAAGIARNLHALHFPLQFPEVFLRERAGFDCILGNPPWEKLHVEAHGFWALRFPGLRALNVTEMNAEIVSLEERRPDLKGELSEEIRISEEARDVMLHGPYPDLGASHPDLYKAFAWRVWHLARDRGAIGVVLPRAALSSSGSATWRKAILEGGNFEDVTMVLNTRGWVFDEAEHRMTIGLLCIRKGLGFRGRLCLWGPYSSLDAFVQGRQGPPLECSLDEFLGWSNNAAFPLLPTQRAGEIFRKMMSHPRFAQAPEWRARPVQGDLNATKGKSEMVLAPVDHSDLWPVYKGASFDIWEPDTGNYYAWAEKEHITSHLQAKRERAGRSKRSAFSEMGKEWFLDPKTLPCLYPRIAFRDVARATDSRTMIPALVPSHCILNHTSPYLLWPEGGAPRNVAFLLGMLSSVPLDWCTRRIVENHVTFDILNGLPIPEMVEPIGATIVSVVGALVAEDERFADWITALGEETCSIQPGDRQELVPQLDAAVSILYGLTRDDLQHIFETFQEGWDYTPRLEQVLAHFDELS